MRSPKKIKSKEVRPTKNNLKSSLKSRNSSQVKSSSDHETNAQLDHNIRETNLRKAVERVQENLALTGIPDFRKVAREFNIPTSTLYDRVKRGKIVHGHIFTEEEENKILEFVKKQGQPMTKQNFKDLVNRYLSINGINWEIGDSWFYSFKHRHPELIIKKSLAKEEGTNLGNESQLKEFYEKLLDIIKENNLQSDQIHNVDECLIDLDVSGKIIATKRSPEFQEIKNKKKECFPLIFCISANRTAMKPLLLLNGEHIPSNIRIPPSIIPISTINDGWSDPEVKSLWFDHFLTYIGKDKSKENNKVHLLLIDNSEAMWDNSLFDIARKHNVILLPFPSHFTHITEPLDNHFFNILKAQTNKFKSDPSFQTIKNKWEIIDFLEEPLYLSFSPKTIQKSFESSGIWPPNYKEKCQFNNYTSFESILTKNVTPSNNNLSIEIAEIIDMPCDEN